MARHARSFSGAFQITPGQQPVTHHPSSGIPGLLVYLALSGRQPHAQEALAARRSAPAG